MFEEKALLSSIHIIYCPSTKGLTRVVVALKIVDSFTGTEERVKARAKVREERWLEALWFE